MRNVARRLVAVVLAAALLSGCDAGGPPPGPASAPSRLSAALPERPAAPAVAEVRAQLADSWVTDGRRGYFVDDAWSDARSPFSLYDTYWQLRLARSDHPDAAVLDRAAVARWLPAALRGTHDGGSLPAMAQIGYAVDIAAMLGLPAGGAGGAIEGLRAGDRYRAGPGSAPDWGSTALAVEALTTAGLPVPAAVTAAVRSGLTTGADAEALLPQLRAAAALAGAGLPRELLAARVGAAFAGLGEVPDEAPDEALDVAWLDAQARLRTAARRLGVAVPAFPVRACDGVPGGPAPDPRLTFYARHLGCARTVVPPAPPHSRAGWPAPDQIRVAQASSLAGLRLARTLGAPDPATADRLRATLFDVWLPAVAGTEGVAGAERTLLASRLRALAAMVAPAERARVDLALARVAPDRSDDLQRLLALADAALLPAGPDRRAAVLRVADAGWSAPHTGSIFAAASDELASRLLGGDTALHLSAMATADSLRLSGGLYRVRGDGGGSLTATVLAAWIGGTSLPPDSWVALGLCRSGRCGDDADPPDGTSLRVLGLIWACAEPRCGEEVPLPL
ncbi:hypothetical protein AB0J72_40355 [Dactylosporangium sp. NPDC049742]|uniref:hypothetical protein n=1 Tax=Dactylosporangium sp. NPDC049742 TaxID=3154737 RepID=UPI00343F92FA